MNIILDIDGTICFDGRHIDKRIIERLSSLHNMGRRIIFASARPIRDLLPVLPTQFHEFTLIGGNDSIISENNHIQTLATIINEDFALIKEIIEKYNLNYIIDDDWNYAAEVATTHTIYQRLDPHRLAQKLSINDIQSPIKTILLNIRQDNFKDIATYLATNGKQLELINHSNELNIDITAKSINKYFAIAHILGTNPIYIAFGNDHNDIKMLNHAQAAYFINDGKTSASLFENENSFTIVEANVNSVSKALDVLISRYKDS
ncbi:HAD-IIB family hydrolase [Staphylococcus devriesei]|uniref:Hydrolase n=1 Tax=Staphylococcus devriesei TaxID=586733 RepID=A0A2T4KC49_9STAP|nr:HAD-IIB family hydrolase [Staphylococcus devriesei]PTE69111.1 hydrolase [Staphylococcus devriesei]RIL69892.1 HAD-IIB family hydrolase [Staphylococcus devriesei]WKU13431.1 HAD-IIB family hydrolase [Staphylococcus devriesei]